MARTNTALFKAARALSHYYHNPANRGDDGLDWDTLDGLASDLHDAIHEERRKARNRADGTSRPWFTVVYDDGKGVMLTHVQASLPKVLEKFGADALFIFPGYKLDALNGRLGQVAKLKRIANNDGIDQEWAAHEKLKRGCTCPEPHVNFCRLDCKCDCGRKAARQ